MMMMTTELPVMKKIALYFASMQPQRRQLTPKGRHRERTAPEVEEATPVVYRNVT